MRQRQRVLKLAYPQTLHRQKATCPVHPFSSVPQKRSVHGSHGRTHVEEKNWTLVRQYIGYQRLAKAHLAQELNSLYSSEWRLLMNFFVPSTKLTAKLRHGSQIVKKYDLPKTPFQRLLESRLISKKTKDKLRNLFSSLHPFQLQRQVQKKIDPILNQADPLPKYILKHNELS